ncbi:hypothetical protein V6N13_031737 [Hibiscus sabdariffa]|uniref:Uncharacterized protein n=1 Tax=Hibiscus sabdariffa TaxID=183260 RepID=A0ABR2CJE6_9ROSI
MDKGKEKEESSAIHPAVAPLSYLLGKWKGEAKEDTPPSTPSAMAKSFTSLTLRLGSPVIAYSHKTWNSTLSTGLAEVLKGTYSAEDKVIKLQSEVVANASKVREISRVYEMLCSRSCHRTSKLEAACFGYKNTALWWQACQNSFSET